MESKDGEGLSDCESLGKGERMLKSDGEVIGVEARLAQSVEHETLNLGVVGSSPTLGEYRFGGLNINNNVITNNTRAKYVLELKYVRGTEV